MVRLYEAKTKDGKFRRDLNSGAICPSKTEYDNFLKNKHKNNLINRLDSRITNLENEIKKIPEIENLLKKIYDKLN